MSVIIDGTAGITTPAETVQGALTTTGNTILGDASTDTLNVGNGGLVKDASGNVGIGVTPSAWGTAYRTALQTGSSAALAGVSSGASDYFSITGNAFLNSSASYRYINSTTAVRYEASSGEHRWYNAASGTAGNAITFTQTMTLDASGNLQFNSGYGSAATAYGCRAWVNFNGTGTVAIRASGNVSSITDNGTGNYTVNFTTSMVDANYVTTGTSSTSSGGSPVIIRGPTTPATGNAIIETIQSNGTNQDPAGVYLAFFR